MRTRVAALTDRPVRYLEAGEGRPVVLLHAFPFSADLWVPVLARLPPGWRAIAPDLRGFRGSGPAFETPGLAGTTMADYARDVVALMAHLDLTSAVIGGISMGGYVALALLREAPGRVAGLLLASTRAAADSPDGRAARDRMLDLVRREGTAGVARELVPKLIGPTAHREQPELAGVLTHLVHDNPASAIEAAIVAMRDRPDSTPLLAGIACPTVVVGGEEDAIVPIAESEALQAAIPGATLVRLPRAGHLDGIAALSRVLAGFPR